MGVNEVVPVGTCKIAKIESFFSPCRKDVCTQSDLTLTSLTSLEARAGDSHDTSLLRQVGGSALGISLLAYNYTAYW